MVTNPKIILALDIGERRIGMAIARSDTRLPQPQGAIEKNEDWLDTLRRHVAEHQAEVLVVGLPRGLDGQETSQTAAVRAVSEQLKALDLPLFLQDEAVTSVKAEQELKDRGVRYNKANVDALAAVYILDDFLHQHTEV